MSQHRRGSIHGGSPVPGHPNAAVSASSSHEVQTRGIPLPGMVPPSRSIHASPMHGNPIHGFINPLGPGGLVHPPPTSHAASGISHHPANVHQGAEKILPPSSPYSAHGSPLRTSMSSGHGSPQDSPHVARHRRDSEHSSGAVSRRGSSDVASPLPEGHPLGSPDGRGRRRSDYSPHQGRSIHDVTAKEYQIKETKSRARPRAAWTVTDTCVEANCDKGRFSSFCVSGVCPGRVSSLAII
ncbi:hypothetical protein EAI_16800 [Harpegnathos saltator]|uniref:Uncharacterized protein n=1 Tax=Harpegnathos saltator TaxID=610380 RepID=E2B8E2_HARSA|nr:hypothetical protein EAI_16800 [Harpegnathos saltator]